MHDFFKSVEVVKATAIETILPFSKQGLTWLSRVFIAINS